jgi:dihydropteroate synthase
MYRHANYHDVVDEVLDELRESMAFATGAGVATSRLLVDPGLGFAKTAEHSYQMLGELERLAALDRPILSGPSRKSFLRRAIGDVPPAERDWATAAAVTASVLHGAHIVRVHAVREMVQAVRVADAILAARRSTPS